MESYDPKANVAALADAGPSTASRRPLVLHTRVVTGVGGGPEKTILNSPRWLSGLGYDALCAYLYPPADRGVDELRKKAAALGASWVGIEDRGPWDLRVARRLLDLCRTHRVAIWHAHDYKTNVLGLLLRRWWPMRLVTTVHGWVTHTRRTPLYYWIDRLALRHYDKVICVSGDLYDRCVTSGVRRERCLVVDNAIDTTQYVSDLSAADAKRRLGIAPDRLLIGAVGRLSEEKNFRGLLHATANLPAQSAVELMIVGEGPQRAELAALARQLGLADRVHLPGFRSDMVPLYRAMDLFVLSSLREGLPNVLLEAMAMEVPVVATRIAGVPRVVCHDVSGLLVEPGDVDGLGRAIAQLLQDHEERVRLAREGRGTVEQRFSFAARMQKIRAIYDEVLAE